MTRRLETPDDARTRLEREALDERERAQLWTRIADSTQGAGDAARRTRAWHTAAIAAPLLAAAAAAAWLSFATQRAAPASTSEHAAAVADACTLDPQASALQLPAHCAQQSVRVAGDDWQLSAGAQVARTGSGAQVHAGRVRFSVRKRAAGTQFRVRVSHGEVRVIGTVFVVEQHAGGGSVTVSEGVIEFAWADGARERVAAGQTLRWPRPQPPPAQPAPTPAPAGPQLVLRPGDLDRSRARSGAARGVAFLERGTALPSKTDATLDTTSDTTIDQGHPGGGLGDAGTRPADAGSARLAPDLDQRLERLLQLQSQKRHGEAIALLKQTLTQPGLSQLQRERISYELGVALEADGRPSCPHWKRHLARFGAAQHPSLSDRVERCR